MVRIVSRSSSVPATGSSEQAVIAKHGRRVYNNALSFIELKDWFQFRLDR